MCYHSCGQYLAVGTVRGLINIYNLKDGTNSHSYNGHNGMV